MNQYYGKNCDRSIYISFPAFCSVVSLYSSSGIPGIDVSREHRAARDDVAAMIASSTSLIYRWTGIMTSAVCTAVLSVLTPAYLSQISRFLFIGVPPVFLNPIGFLISIQEPGL